MRSPCTAILLLALLPGPLAGQRPSPEAACAAGESAACLDAARRLLREGPAAADTVRAVTLQHRACELGSGDGCNDYGVSLELGRGTPRNERAALERYDQACRLESAYGCFNQGKAVLDGRLGATRNAAVGSQLLAKACDRGHLDGCVDLALAELDGRAGARQPAAAHSRLLRACDAGSGRGCNEAGFQKRDSTAVPGDLAGAASLFKRSCDELSNGLGCTALGFAYERGQGVPRSAARAESFYRKACSMAEGLGCSNLGVLRRDGVVGPPDSAEAARLFGEGCKLGSGAACSNQGQLVLAGWGGRRPDSAAGRALHRTACDAGSAVGCRRLGYAVRSGGGRRDSADAHALFRRACEARDGPACNEEGLGLERGVLGRPDSAAARALYRKACDLGESYGCNNYAVALRDGRPEERDPIAANAIFERECTGGNPLACANLGYSYEYGRGVRMDEARALEMYRRGCSAGSSYGCSRLARLGADTTAILALQKAERDSARASEASGLAAPPGATGRGESARLWALVVGISKYRSAEIRPLAYARKDAEAFARFLMSPQGGGFPREQVQVLLDEEATAAGLRRGLHSFLRQANADDRVLVYFAGHGRQPGGLGGIPYFLTYDTDPREMAVTAVPMDEFKRAVSQSITARQIIAFIDACHSGGVTVSTRSGEDNQLINRYLQELSRGAATVATLAASQEGQESLEGPEYGGGHGAFTWFLLQGLSGEADRAAEQGDESGTVTLRELAAYVTRRVKAATANQQEPSLSYLRSFPDVVLSVVRAR